MEFNSNLKLLNAGRFSFSSVLRYTEQQLILNLFVKHATSYNQVVFNSVELCWIRLTDADTKSVVVWLFVVYEKTNLAHWR